MRRLLGARFDSRPDALHALEHLRAAYGAREAGVAPLADATPNATLLAGFFEAASGEGVRSVLIEHGGEIVTDMDEEQLE